MDASFRFMNVVGQQKRRVSGFSHAPSSLTPFQYKSKVKDLNVLRIPFMRKVMILLHKHLTLGGQKEAAQRGQLAAGGDEAPAGQPAVEQKTEKGREPTQDNQAAGDVQPVKAQTLGENWNDVLKINSATNPIDRGVLARHEWIQSTNVHETTISAVLAGMTRDYLAESPVFVMHQVGIKKGLADIAVCLRTSQLTILPFLVVEVGLVAEKHSDKETQSGAYIANSFDVNQRALPVGFSITATPEFLSVYGLRNEPRGGESKQCCLFIGKPQSIAAVLDTITRMMVSEFVLRRNEDGTVDIKDVQEIQTPIEEKAETRGYALFIGGDVWKVYDYRRMDPGTDRRKPDLYLQYVPKSELVVNTDNYKVLKYPRIGEIGSKPTSGRHMKDLVRAVAAMHTNEHVHGDIRLSNCIFLDDSSEGKKARLCHLIDFDYSGKHGVAKYPSGWKAGGLGDGKRHAESRAKLHLKYTHDVYSVCHLLRTFALDSDQTEAAWTNGVEQLEIMESFSDEAKVNEVLGDMPDASGRTSLTIGSGTGSVRLREGN